MSDSSPKPDAPGPLDIVKEYFPTASKSQAVAVLWGCTGWPGFFQDDKPVEVYLREQLAESARKSNADPEVALAISDQEMDAAMQQLDRSGESA